MNKPCGVFAEYYISCVLLCVCWIMNDCTGEMNLPLRLRCVRCYTFTQWINLAVCLLDYEWLSGEMNQPLRLRCVRWYTFTQWINLVVCLLDYEWLSGEINQPLRLRCVCWYYAMNEPCGVFVVLWNDVRARWICPYAYGVFAVIYLCNE